MPLFLRDKKSVLIVGCLVFLNLLLISIQVPRGAEQTYFQRAVFTVFSPFQRVTSALLGAVSGAWRNYSHLRKVRTENQKLKKDIFFLRQQNILLQHRVRLLRGEEKLRQELSLMGKSVSVARIIGLDASNYFRSVIINKGSLDGIGRNMAVCDKHGNLIGRTVDPVTFNESRVQLITDSDSGVSVISSGPDKIVGILAGESEGLCRMKFVLASAKGGSEGESLITTGFDKIFPPGIKVGLIVSLSQDNTLFKNIVVKPYFNFNDLDQVAIFNERFQELGR